MATTAATSSSTGALSSLGLGSDGALNYDTIDQLRKVDETAILNPIDTKITTNTTKQNDLATLTTLAATLKASTSSLSSEMSYLKRSTSVSNSDVSVTAQSGTTIQDFSIHVNALAKQDIYQSSNFLLQTSAFSSTNDTLTLGIGSNSYNFNITPSTSLSDLRDMINNQAGSKVTASILNVGGTNPYKLIIKSNDTGNNNAITFSSGNTATLTSLGLDVVDNHLQTASDAKFTYNGVTISRTTNSITDLVSGLTINLNKEQDTGVNTTVAITQDWNDVKSTITSLVTSYNNLISSLSDATKYDTETKTAGTFQGVNEIKSLSQDAKKQILNVDNKGRSLEDYGLSLNDNGYLEFTESTFNAKVNGDPKDVQDYFMGTTTYSTTQYLGKSVTSGALNVTANQFKINGTSIVFNTSSNASISDNLTAIQNAINNSNLAGIEATIGTNNNINIKSTINGLDLEISGDSATLSSLGFQETTVYAKSTTTNGLFTSFNDLLNSYINSKDGVLSLYKNSLTSEKTSLTDERAKKVSQLDTKYALMAKRFAAYDSIINQLNSSFDSLSLLIKQSYTSKN